MRPRIELKIPSQLVYLGVPDAVLMELASDLPFDQKQMDELSTSVIEACTNAMEHGNRLREDQPVEVHFDFGESEIEVAVFDHGDGFVSRLTHLADVTLELNQRVFAGDAVGKLAESERSGKKPRLHYELLVDGVPYNPLYYLE